MATIKALLGTMLVLIIMVAALCAAPVILIGVIALAVVAAIVFVLVGVFIGLKDDFQGK